MDEELRTFVGRLIRLLVTVLVLGILLNDGVQVGLALSRASKGMNAAMSAALDTAGKTPDAVDAGQAAAAAAAVGVGTRLDAYAQQVGDSMGMRKAQVSLEVSSVVGKTVLAAPIIGLVRGTKRAQWYTDPRVSLKQTKQVDVYGPAQ